jgi:hypothetical protein
MENVAADSFNPQARIGPHSGADNVFACGLNAMPFNEGKSHDCPTLGGARMGELVNGFGKLGSAHSRYARAVKR